MGIVLDLPQVLWLGLSFAHFIVMVYGLLKERTAWTTKKSVMLWWWVGFAIGNALLYWGGFYTGNTLGK